MSDPIGCVICKSCDLCAIHAWTHQGGEDRHEDRTHIAVEDCEYRAEIELEP